MSKLCILSDKIQENIRDTMMEEKYYLCKENTLMPSNTGGMGRSH